MLDSRTAHRENGVFSFESANPQRVLKLFDPALRRDGRPVHYRKIENLHTPARADFDNVCAILRKFDAQYAICHSVSVPKASRSFDKAAGKWRARPSER